MAVLELATIALAFGVMALVFGLQERTEERRILARAEAVLAREGAFDLVAEDDEAPRPVELRDVA